MTTRVRLVESIPADLSDLADSAPSEPTHAALIRLCNAATMTIDLTAMYWSLLHDPTSADESGFTDAQIAAFGQGKGKELFDALVAAVGRGVKLRILESPGFGGAPESSKIHDAAPEKVEIRQIAMPDWYGGGIMHQKMWIFDAAHVYLGSANMDWRSLTQVKELGLLVEDSSAIAADVGRYFNAWWKFSALPRQTGVGFDRASQVWRRVPSWSSIVPDAERIPSPLEIDVAPSSNRSNQIPLDDGAAYVTGCPDELCCGGREFDRTALVETIADAQRSICVSVMDFAPVGLYSRSPDADFGPGFSTTPVWWPELIDALLKAAITRRVWVGLLISKWAHSSPLLEPLLRTLKQTGDAGRAEPHMSGGTVEIRSFVIPGWDSTVGQGRRFPGHSRVNHAKYIVTERRANVGTSNMTWDYFTMTAGTSINTTHSGVVRDLQTVFDRDWNSRYAVPL